MSDRQLLTVLCLLVPPSIATSLEIRLVPSETIFINENNRRTGIYDLMIHSIATINDDGDAVMLSTLDIRGFEYGEPTLVDRVPLERYSPRNELRFPLSGRWYVGSASSVRSHHRARPAHEFALDLLKIGAGGKSHRGDGTRHEDYHAYGEAVRAVADGVVERSVGDVPETGLPRAGESRRDFAIRVLDAMWKEDPTGRIAEGNLVILRHEGGERSTYVHLRSGSVRVAVGDRVRQGQIIGEVGLSGDGFEPHLHFQLNAGPEPQYSRALPAYFSNVRPVPFASSIDMSGDRLYMAGEFIETLE